MGPMGPMGIPNIDSSLIHTLWLLAFDPLSVGMITSKVVADSLVDGAVVVQFTVQSVRIRTALRRNGRGIIPFMETANCTSTEYC